MPTTYTCDNCDVTATTLNEWYTVAVAINWMDPQAPNPPGGATNLSVANPALIFHAYECVVAWCQTAGIPAPEASNVRQTTEETTGTGGSSQANGNPT